MGIEREKSKGMQGKKLFSSFPFFIFQPSAFILSALIFHPSFFILSAHASYISDARFQESLQSFKKGDYKDAMLGFMDVVVEEPENGPARNYLKESGRRVLEAENKNIQLQREHLLRGVEAMKKRLVSLEEAKQAKIRDWDRLFSRAKSLAGDADSLREAVSAYEEFVRKTPVYAELKDRFSEKIEILKRTFYDTIKARYPEMVGEKAGIDEADMAGVFFLGEALNDSQYRYGDSGRTENVLAKSSRIKYLRGGVSALFDHETRALELYSTGKFAEADALFRKILKACGANEEAAFYSGLAAERAVATLAARPHSPCPDEVCRGDTGADAALSAGGQITKNNALQPARKAVYKNRSSAPDRRGSVFPAVPASKPVYAAAQPGAENAPAADTSVDVALPAGRQETEGNALQTADELYEQGVREFSVGDYGAAANSWSECLRLNSDHVKAKLGIQRLKSSGG